MVRGGLRTDQDNAVYSLADFERVDSEIVPSLILWNGTTVNLAFEKRFLHPIIHCQNHRSLLLMPGWASGV